MYAAPAVAMVAVMAAMTVVAVMAVMAAGRLGADHGHDHRRVEGWVMKVAGVGREMGKVTELSCTIPARNGQLVIWVIDRPDDGGNVLKGERES